MILSDREIAMMVDAEELIFDPVIIRTGVERQIRSSSVDLRLGYRFRKLRKSTKVPGLEEKIVINPAQIEDFDEIMANATELVEIRDHPYELEPDPTQVVIAETLEYISLPMYLAARVEGRSSLARIGVSVHNTAPTIQAGYRGRIALELSNNGPLTIALEPGRLRICQLVLERVSAPPTEPGGGRFRDRPHI